MSNNDSNKHFDQVLSIACQLYDHCRVVLEKEGTEKPDQQFNACCFFLNLYTHAKAVQSLRNDRLNLASIATLVLVRALIETYESIAYLAIQDENEFKFRLQLITYHTKLDRIQLQYKANSLNDCEPIRQFLELKKDFLKHPKFECSTLSDLKKRINKPLSKTIKQSVSNRDRFHLTLEDRCQEHDINVERFKFYYAICCSFAHSGGYSIEIALSSAKDNTAMNQILEVAFMFLSKSILTMANLFSECPITTEDKAMLADYCNKLSNPI